MCYTLHTRLIPMSIFLLRKNSFTFSVIQCYVHCNGYSLNSLNPSHPKKKKKMDVMEMGEVGFIMGRWEIFKVCLHSWQRNANPLFYEDPHYITCLLFFEFCPLSPPLPCHLPGADTGCFPHWYTDFGHSNLGVPNLILSKTETTIKCNSSFFIKSAT